jgi:hypothetical protein
VQRDLGAGMLTMAFRRSRRVRWRGLRGRGVPELQQSLAGVSVWRRQDLVKVSLEVLEQDRERQVVRELR